LVDALAAGGRVAAVANAHPPLQQLHAALVEHIAHQAVALVHAQGGAACGGDARRVLAAMLQDGQAVVQRGRDLSGSDDADDAAHEGCVRCWRKGISRARPCAPGMASAQGCERTMPSIWVRPWICALSCSASARLSTGPALTRVS